MNKYLEKIALRRVVEEYSKGLLATPLHELAKKGFVKPMATYVKGMKLGNQNIAKAMGARVQKISQKNASGIISSTSGSDFFSLSGKGTPGHVFFNPKAKGLHPLEKELGVRHELIELSEAASAKKRGVKLLPDSYSLSDEHKFALDFLSNSDDYKVRGLVAKARRSLARMDKHIETPRPVVFQDEFDQTIGNHHSLGVLSRESEEIRKVPWLKGAPVSKYRNLYGEGKTVFNATGKRFGSDPMKKIDHARANQYQAQRHLEEPYDLGIPMFVNGK